MGDIQFEWDPAKARLNLRKHGIAFEEAQTAFSDEWALIMGDPDDADDEARLVLLGMSTTLRILVVVHVYRASRDTIRIISARRATRRERAIYGQRLNR